ncbi:MAG: FMN-binding protein [Bacteroidota bacterium]|nr:FMN-binding protein [Bacteroidota bacterium]
MKKTYVLLSLALAVVLSAVALNSKNHFKDGVYKGESRSVYTNEPFWGQVTLEIKNDNVTLITFRIVDKEKNEVFGPDYEKHFKDSSVYAEQCRNEVKGIKAYTKAFIKNKSLEPVDAITGATWSYNLFKEALNDALGKALNK